MANSNGDRPQEGQPKGDVPGEPAEPAEEGQDGGVGSGEPRASSMQAIRAFWNNPAYRFIALFLPYLGLASFGYPIVVKHFNWIIQAFIRATAGIEFLIFDLVSGDARLDGKMVWYGQFVVKIIDECTGLYEMLIFTAAVLAFPTSWAKRAIGVFLGCPLIYLFNVVRIAGLIVVGRHWSKAFEFMHLYFWQATMIVMITSVWLLWIVKVVQREDQTASHSD